jgi:predicted transcriptional regulator
MLKTVKIPEVEYRLIKTLARKRGRLLQYVFAEAIRQYLATERAKENAA